MPAAIWSPLKRLVLPSSSYRQITLLIAFSVLAAAGAVSDAHASARDVSGPLAPSRAWRGGLPLKRVDNLRRGEAAARCVVDWRCLAAPRWWSCSRLPAVGLRCGRGSGAPQLIGVRLSSILAGHLGFVGNLQRLPAKPNLINISAACGRAVHAPVQGRRCRRMRETRLSSRRRCRLFGLRRPSRLARHASHAF